MSEKPSAPLQVRLRPDLVVSQVETARGRRWHVKDPIALKFFQFDLCEFALLQLLDGQATIDQIIASYHREFAPQHITARQLLFFIDEGRRNGLLILERPPTAAVTDDDTQPAVRRLTRWLGYLNVLALRLPGLNPDRFLDGVYPFVRGLFTPLTTFCGAGVILAALLLVLLRWEQFVDRLPDVQAFFTPTTALWLAAALAGVKVFHELAHALACKHFGGECHEIGVMLLVFVPCLYCNVSDSWLLARRRERMLITAAGLWTELLLAGAATFIWWFAVDGPVRMGALSVMLVGSLNTLLLNGNPLMRYDGYYLLSDALQIPNLGSESSRVLSDLWRRYALGLTDGLPPRLEHDRRVLAAYGLASYAYRLFIFTAILLAVHAFARQYRLQTLAWFVTVLSLSSLLLPPLVTAVQPLLRRRERRRIDPGHAVTTVVVLGAILGGILLLPIPHSLRAPFVLDADGTERVFVTVPGQLISARQPGELVQPGDMIGRLQNLQLDQQQQRLSSERAVLQQQLDAYRSVRSVDAESSARIPATEPALADLEQQLATLATQQARLELKASRGGQVLTPPNVPRAPVNRDELPGWSGSPLDPANLGCRLEAGTPFCLIGQLDDISATVIVAQDDVPLVRKDQPVELLLNGLPDRTLQGTVQEISPVPVDSLPRELAAIGVVPIDPDAREERRPQSPVYRVRVQLSPEALQTPPLRWSTGEARIRLAAEPLVYRLWRGIQRTFHFEL
ncbi:MAG: HlyD family efflux transporter periplasmic adaptor subunit [Planctomycetaceae bacterium]